MNVYDFEKSQSVAFQSTQPIVKLHHPSQQNPHDFAHVTASAVLIGLLRLRETNYPKKLLLCTAALRHAI